MQIAPGSHRLTVVLDLVRLLQATNLHLWSLDLVRQLETIWFYQHRRPSTNEAQNLATFLVGHTRETGHAFNNKDFQILDKVEQWHRRGIKEAILFRSE